MQTRMFMLTTHRFCGTIYMLFENVDNEGGHAMDDARQTSCDPKISPQRTLHSGDLQMRQYL
jgi:hypothetical protein